MNTRHRHTGLCHGTHHRRLNFEMPVGLRPVLNAEEKLTAIHLRIPGEVVPLRTRWRQPDVAANASPPEGLYELLLD